MKAEIDALQIAADKRDRPWWQVPSVLIALVAVLVALGTALYSGRQQAQQGTLQAEAALSEVIDQIANAEQSQFAFAKTYADDPQTYSNAYRAVGIQLMALSFKAADLIDGMPKQTSAAEFYVVATTLQAQTGLTPRVLRYYQNGLDKADDLRTYEYLAQAKGNGLFLIGRDVAARKTFATAVDPPARFQPLSAAYRYDELAWTQIVWSTNERTSVGDCAVAKAHVDAAAELIGKAQELGLQSSHAPQLSNEQAAWEQQCGAAAVTG